MGVRERTQSKRKPPQRKMKIPLVLLVACVASLQAASLMDSVLDESCQAVCCAETTTAGQDTTTAGGETTTAGGETTTAGGETNTAGGETTSTAGGETTATAGGETTATAGTPEPREGTTTASEDTTTADPCDACDCDAGNGAGSAS